MSRLTEVDSAGAGSEPAPTSWLRQPGCALLSRPVRLSLALALVVGVFETLDSTVLWYLKYDNHSRWVGFGRLVLYYATVVWFTSLILVRQRWLRWGVLLVATAAIAVDQVYTYHLNGDGFTPHEMFLALENPATSWESVVAYWPLAWPVALVCVGVVPLAGCVLYRVTRGVPGRWTALASVTAVPLLTMMLTEGYGPGGQAVMPIRVPAFFLLYACKPMLPERDPPYFAPADRPRADHIVLILDESVMGTHLGINGYPRKTTPGLRRLTEQGQAVSLGVCSSACNYSVGSLLTILSGTRVDQMKENYKQFLTRPSLLAYAHQGGYEIQFLNSQDYLPWIAHEKSAFGEHLQTMSAPKHRLPCCRWDHALIDPAVRFIESHDRTFTFIAKRGLHHPYNDKCPSDHMRYRPVSSGPGWDEEFLLTLNSYDNGMLWACDDFLTRLHERLSHSGRSVLILYTSDHGQILPGQKIPGNKYQRTHAMIHSPSPAVADVPLVLLATGAADQLLARLPRRQVDHVSHFQIAPSMLWLMGYGLDQIRGEYGWDLWHPPAELPERTFFEGKPVQGWKPFHRPDMKQKLDLIRTTATTRAGSGR